MGVEAAALTHLPSTQDSTGIVHNSRRCNQQSDSESNFGQVQTHKVPPEALAIFMGQPDTMTNNREKYCLQDQTPKVAPEALNFFFESAGYHVELLCSVPSTRTHYRDNAGGYAQLSLNNNSLKFITQ
jgi:hypothetical protein